MDLYFYRLSLKANIDLFTSLNGLPRREIWIRKFFAERREFIHNGNVFVFVPEEPRTILSPKLIVGWIARARLVQEFTPPEQGLTPTRHESWRAALIVIDPTEHQDGQKVAIEQHPDVGKSSAIMKSLVKQMTVFGGYSVEVYPIIEEASFWRFAEKHSYKIKRLTFDVAVPNMFNGADDFADELRRLRDRNNAHTVRTTLVSDTSLNTRADNIAAIINYTEKGMGAIQAKAVDGTSYNSRNYTKHEKVDADRSSDIGDSFCAKIAAFLDKVF